MAGGGRHRRERRRSPSLSIVTDTDTGTGTGADADSGTVQLSFRCYPVPILSTDGVQAYLAAVGEAFFSPEQPPGAVHFGQVVKSFTNNRRDYDKVAPAHGPPQVTKRIICGTSPIGEISTSITEREMLALRTNLWRLVRRGSGHSKSLEHHTAAVAAFASWANFCRPSSALKSKTPAMVSGLADHR